MDNIIIRSIEISDWEDLFALQQCPKVRRGTLKMPYLSATETRQRLEKRSDNRYQLVAMEPPVKPLMKPRLVGIITLAQQSRSRQHVGYVGMAVHDDYQGQGIGSRLLHEAIEIADQWLNLKRIELSIELSVFVDNAPAVHLYKKFGFEIEGTLKKYAFRAGSFVDAYTMARIV